MIWIETALNKKGHFALSKDLFFRTWLAWSERCGIQNNFQSTPESQLEQNYISKINWPSHSGGSKNIPRGRVTFKRPFQDPILGWLVGWAVEAENHHLLFTSRRGVKNWSAHSEISCLCFIPFLSRILKYFLQKAIFLLTSKFLPSLRPLVPPELKALH